MVGCLAQPTNWAKEVIVKHIVINSIIFFMGDTLSRPHLSRQVNLFLFSIDQWCYRAIGI